MRLIQPLARFALAAALLLTGLAPNAAALADDAPPFPVPTGDPAAPAGGPLNHYFPPGCGPHTAHYTEAPNQAIPDGTGFNPEDPPGVLTDTITASGLGGFLWQVQVTTTITHGWNQDLDIFLISPAGTRVTLTTDNGGSNANVFNGTRWLDSAGETNPPGPVTLTTFDNNVAETHLAPEEPLSAFRGENPNGLWTLEVHDDEIVLAGTLVDWGLVLEVLETAPTAITRKDTSTANDDIPDGSGDEEENLYIEPPAGAALGRLELYTEIDHPRVSDLEIELDVPNGPTLTIASHAGGDNANVFNGALWTDTAGVSNPPGAVTDSAFVSGTVETVLAPQEPLGAAAGLSDLDDDWVLRIRDTVTGAVGTLGQVMLSATFYSCLPILYLDLDEPDNARLGVPAPVTVEVENLGAATTAPVYLTATLPVSVSFHSFLAPGWTCGGVAAGALGGALLCNRASLGAGAITTVTVVLNPPPAPLETDKLEAEVSTAGGIGMEGYDDERLDFTAHSANGMPWDVHDAVFDPGEDTGGVGDGGQDAFDSYGELRLRIYSAGGTLLLATEDELYPFGLTYAPGSRWRTTTPVVTGTIQVSRDLYAPVGADWLRYVDTFTNTGGAARTVWVAWGGDLGSDGDTLLQSTSSGDALLTPADTWAVTIENDDPPVDDPPVGYILRSPADTTYQGPGDFRSDVFTTTWPITGDDDLGHVYKLVLAPGASASLAYFLYRGLNETDEGPEDCEFYNDCQPAPASGSQVTLAETTAAALVAAPNFCGLSPAQRALIVNWPGLALNCPSVLYLPLVTK